MKMENYILSPKWPNKWPNYFHLLNFDILIQSSCNSCRIPRVRPIRPSTTTKTTTTTVSVKLIMTMMMMMLFMIIHHGTMLLLRSTMIIKSGQRTTIKLQLHNKMFGEYDIKINLKMAKMLWKKTVRNWNHPKSYCHQPQVQCKCRNIRNQFDSKCLVSRSRSPILHLRLENQFIIRNLCACVYLTCD